MKRLFLAIDLPERIIDDISATYQAIQGVRWMREEQLHITLRFLGEVPDDKENALIAAMQGIATSPFHLSLKGTGFFPPRGEVRILWVGITYEPLLHQLHTHIENASVAIGFERERRRFSPHITVARCNHAHRDRIAHYLITNSLFSTEPFEVTAFHLYASHLGKNGAHYTKETSFALNNRI